MPNLIVLTGSQRGCVVAVDDGAVIGRAVGAALTLADDPKVSSRHAQVVLGESGLVLEDLGSTNGTYLNGSRIEAPIPLREGDILHIGTTELLLSERSSLDMNAATPANPFQQFGGGPVPSSSFDVRLVADDTDEELVLEPSRRGAGITLMLPVVQRVERSFSKATDLASLVESIALSFSQAVNGDGVLVELQSGLLEGRRSEEQTDAWGWEQAGGRRGARAGVRAWVRGGLLVPIAREHEGFEVRERLLQRALHGGGALLGRTDGGEMALCLGLPHAAGVAGAVYVHGVREGITQEDLRPLLLLANLAGVHCRTHLLVTELRERNEDLEAAQSRLSSWNEELQSAAEERAAELARTEANYRSLFHESRDGNFTTDRRGRIEAINPTAAEILGLGLEEAVGRPLWLVFRPEAVGRMLSLDPKRATSVTQRFGLNLDRLGTIQSPDVLEIPMESPSGKERMVEVLVRPILAGTEVDGIHVVLRDVTARHEAEERTRLLTRIVANVREAVVSTTLDGVVTSWNPGAERLYQYSPEEVLGQTLPTVPDDRGAELESILAAVAEGHSLAVRTERVSRDDRVVPVLATFAPVADAEGGIVGVVELARDLSDQLELEQRMRWQERMASFGELAAGLAHELGNPLANLRSGVEYLLDTRREGDPELNESLDLLHTEIERLHRLVKQALDLARWQPPALAPVDGQELLRYVAAVVKDRAAELGVELVNLAEGGPTIQLLGDADQLKQALLNLVSNAFGAMPRGGRLELSLHPAEGEPPLARLAVRDTGCGIPAAAQERMFDMFFSGRSDGSGIGLAVVKRIVDLHQGRTRVESEEDEGTTIELALPVAPELAQDPEVRP